MFPSTLLLLSNFAFALNQEEFDALPLCDEVESTEPVLTVDSSEIQTATTGGTVFPDGPSPTGETELPDISNNSTSTNSTSTTGFAISGGSTSASSFALVALSAFVALV